MAVFVYNLNISKKNGRNVQKDDIPTCKSEHNNIVTLTHFYGWYSGKGGHTHVYKLPEQAESSLKAD